MKPGDAFRTAYELARWCGRGRVASALYGLRARRSARRSARLEFQGRKRVGM